jgi:hypothetical protein
MIHLPCRLQPKQHDVTADTLLDNSKLTRFLPIIRHINGLRKKLSKSIAMLVVHPSLSNNKPYLAACHHEADDDAKYPSNVFSEYYISKSKC